MASPTKLKIDGMTCEHCVRRVREALEAAVGEPGAVEVNLQHGEALVGAEADPDELLRAVRSAGYGARILEV